MYKFAEFVSYDNMTQSRTYDLLAPEESYQPLEGRELGNSYMCVLQSRDFTLKPIRLTILWQQSLPNMFSQVHN